VRQCLLDHVRGIGRHLEAQVLKVALKPWTVTV
jgi:hypothetical protein